MTDRMVRQIFPRPDREQAERGRPFSSFGEHTNIVLVGDPGSGKSHLFNEVACTNGGRLLTARAFLNVPNFDSNEVLFIDALDERRAGRTDQDTINAIVRKLFAVQPSKVRISCRAQDWLGDTDLTTFRDYFDSNGGVVVLHLNGLSEDEQEEVLRAQGMQDDDVEAFLREAASRGLEEFVQNPQNLIMLRKAVRDGAWPSTRFELFSRATDLLLAEQNTMHSRSATGKFSANELRSVAGAISAARLIGDVEGISLTDHEIGDDYPSYRSIGFHQPEMTVAALSRRTFAAKGPAECVDYTHRTTAEFLGAAWLAKQIRNGLPLGRVRALIGVEGYPAAELRGLHAWLAVHLPEHADTLIDADPYGIVTYGDAGSLAPASRRRLLDSLARLSEVDPWFRSDVWYSPSLGALVGGDMVSEIREILRSNDAPFVLRSLVIDALAAGVPLPELEDDLLAIVRRTDAPYAERRGALAALTKIGNAARSRIVDAYRSGIGVDASSLRLRAAIIAEIYDELSGPTEIVGLLLEALSNEPEVPGGAFSSLVDCVPRAHIKVLLDQFEHQNRAAESRAKRRNIWEVASAFDHILLRAIEELGDELSGEELWRWLQTRISFRDSYPGGTAEQLREYLRNRRDLMHGIWEAFLRGVSVDQRASLLMHDFHEATLHAADPDDIGDWVLQSFHASEPGSDKALLLYELSFSYAFGGTRRADDRFDRLYELGDTQAELTQVRDRSIFWSIPDWRSEESRRVALDRIEEQRGLANVLAEFHADREAIRVGADKRWIAWIAKVYFGIFRDLDRKAAPLQRLLDVLGEENAGTAIEGIVALLQRQDAPTLTAVVEMAAQQQGYDWWLGLIAGMNEAWRQWSSIETFPDELWRIVLAIDLSNPTFTENDNTTVRCDYAWKLSVLKARPDLARDAYLATVRAQLGRGLDHIAGLHELLTSEDLLPFRHEVTYELLRDFSLLRPRHLQSLLDSALDDPAGRGRLIPMARTALDALVSDKESRDMWLVAAYLASPDEYSELLHRAFQEGDDLVWLLRDMAGFQRGNAARSLSLRARDLGLVARCVGARFSNASHPIGGWGGDTNPWDAADFVRRIVDLISTNSNEEATGVLERLAQDEGLISYRDYIKHALANQRIRHREANYRRPNWQETITTLCNGVPANVADLHALLVAQLADLKVQIAASNTDIYKRFWNEDGHGRITVPKPEESGRDEIVDRLRARLSTLGLFVEPEAHMAADKRADFVVALSGWKVPVEVKRDYHADVWSAAETQLDRLYTRDPEASGYGVYCVLWFGEKRLSQIPAPPGGLSRPSSAGELEEMLRALLPPERHSRLEIVVIDVSGTVSSTPPAPTTPPPPKAARPRLGTGRPRAGRGFSRRRR